MNGYLAETILAAALVALAACTTAREEVPPEIPPEDIREVILAEPFEPRWWLEVALLEAGIELRLPDGGSLLPPVLPPERRIDVDVPLGEERAREVREQVAAHEGEPLVALLHVAPDALLEQVLETLRRLHEAGVRRIDPGFLYAMPSPAVRRAVPLPE